MRVPVFAVTFALFAFSAHAQSVITLDDFDLDEEAKPQAAPAQTSEMETCLLDPSACANREYQSGSDLSLDDVVNLGIVDHESVPTTTSTASTASTTSSASATASTAPLPSIDIEILFDYNSDQVREDQFAKLSELSNLLRSEKFEAFRFVFLGHTDAKGSDSYNRELSTRRAESVARIVRGFAGLGTDRTVTSGLGFSRLKDPSNPLGAQNRRVQLLLIPRW